MPIVPARGAVHSGDCHKYAGGSEMVVDAVSDEPDAKHGDGKNDDANQD